MSDREWRQQETGVQIAQNDGGEVGGRIYSSATTNNIVVTQQLCCFYHH